MSQPPPIMDYEGSRWREEFWRGREYEDRVERIALTAELPPRGTRLVEIGAGFGRLADLYRGYDQIILLDYARSMLKDARDRLGSDPRFTFIAADLYNLPFADNSLDTALTIRVLHHVANIPAAFTEIARVVRPQGHYLTDFANKRHLKALLKYHLGRANGANPYTLDPYEFVKLNFDYHPTYIRQQLNQVHFEIQSERAVSTFRIGGVKRLVPTSLLVSMDGALQQITAPLKIAPSILYKTQSKKAGAPQLNPTLFRCVQCHTPNATLVPRADEGLVPRADEGVTDTTMHCLHCSAQFSKTDGIWELKTTA